MNTSTSTLVLIRASWALRWARKRHWWNGRLKGAGWWGGFETGQQTDAFWSIDPSFPTTGTQKRCRVPVCCSVCCCFSVSLSCRLLATSFVPLVVLLWGARLLLRSWLCLLLLVMCCWLFLLATGTAHTKPFSLPPVYYCQKEYERKQEQENAERETVSTTCRPRSNCLSI